MPRYVAFLRAVNVGGHTVKMDHLRRLFAEMGFTDVATYIASGNVIFDATGQDTEALEHEITTALEAALGFRADAFVRTLPELAEIARCRPFSDGDLDAEGHALYIGFLAEAPGDDARRKLPLLNTAVDEFHLHGRELYWLCRTKISESEVSGPLLGKTLGGPVTLRNSTTVRKIAARHAREDA